jgi:hypothetical protein
MLCKIEYIQNCYPVKTYQLDNQNVTTYKQVLVNNLLTNIVNNFGDFGIKMSETCKKLVFSRLKEI